MTDINGFPRRPQGGPAHPGPAQPGQHAGQQPGQHAGQQPAQPPRGVPPQGGVPPRPAAEPAAAAGAPAAPTGPRTYRVVVVDDHAMFRTGVKAEIGRRSPWSARRPTRTPRSGHAAHTKPDVVLLDVHLPGGGGIEVLRKVHEKNPEQKFLALSVSDAAEDVIGVIRAGARGYVTKSISGPELIDAIRRVAEGDAVFSPRLAGFVLDAFSGAIDLATVDEDLDRLSQREREVLRLIARGYAYKEVAQGAVHLDQDRGDPREQRAAQAAAVQPAPADPLGHRPPAGLRTGPGTADAERPRPDRPGAVVWSACGAGWI